VDFEHPGVAMNQISIQNFKTHFGHSSAIYWPTDSFPEVVVYSTLSLPVYCSSSVPLIWNGAFCSPYFSVSPHCKVRIHWGIMIQASKNQ